MLSLLDAMTDTEMETVVEQLTLSDRVRSALLGEDNPSAQVLRQARWLERWPGSPTEAPVSEGVLEAHREAVRWTTLLMGSAGAAFTGRRRR
jgi:c-di-GMP-related signal transduction protein